MKQKIVLAGATGFIGRWIIKEFQDDYHIIALSRKKVVTNPNNKILWRSVDLYSMSSTEKALEGADIAIYLVHSMQPSTRLNQGKFEDTDLLLADIFLEQPKKTNSNRSSIWVEFFLKTNTGFPIIYYHDMRWKKL